METLTVPGNLDSLEPIRDFIKKAAGEANLEKKSTYRLILAVDEIATNIILHGYEEANLSGDIDLIAEIDSDRLKISLVDDAIPYDPTQQAVPYDLEFELEDRAIGGLGVYLTLQSLDGFEYEHVNNQNRNIFIMNRPKD
jgi:anti-sigma regulatory factor (Ser/Thr protein kinase)